MTSGQLSPAEDRVFGQDLTNKENIEAATTVETFKQAYSVMPQLKRNLQTKVSYQPEIFTFLLSREVSLSPSKAGRGALFSQKTLPPLFLDPIALSWTFREEIPGRSLKFPCLLSHSICPTATILSKSKTISPRICGPSY